MSTFRDPVAGVMRLPLTLLVLVLSMSCQIEEEPTQTLADEASAVPRDDGKPGSEQEVADDAGYGLHVINADPARLRKLMDGVAPWRKDCEEWSADDSRVGMLVPSFLRLFVGRPKAGGDGIDHIEKTYEVSSVSISGSPFEGTVHVMLQGVDMPTEKVCLERLRGTTIGWGQPGNSGYPDMAGKAVVRDVQFSRAARLESSGEVTATGAFVAILTVSESTMSMVFREIGAHFWGIVASLLLTVLMALATGLVRRVWKSKAGAWVRQHLPSRT